MRTALDKGMLYAAYVYISLPFLIFTIGWLKWYYAVFIALVTIVSFFLSLKKYVDLKTVNLKKHTGKILIGLIAIIVWVYFSGIGGFSYQNEDHQYRNAIFRDLITYKWPVIYNVTGIKSPLYGQNCMLIYYVGYWLPSAIVGKVFNWEVANFFLFLWTIFGLTLIFYFLCRAINKFSLKILWVFIFFSNLYILGSFARFPIKTVLTQDYVSWINIWLPDSGDFYWVFNQCITPYLIVTIILNNIPKQNILFVLAFCALQGPFAFIGIIPFVAYTILNDVFREQGYKNIVQRFAPYFSFQNITGVFFVALPVCLYLFSNTSAQHFAILHLGKLKFLVFALLAYVILALILFPLYRKNPYYYISIAILVVVPFFQVGYSLDFGGRVSIPAMFILMFFVAKAIATSPDKRSRLLLTGYMMLCAITPGLQIARSVVFTAYGYIDPPFINNYLYNRASPWGYQRNISPKPADAKDKNFLRQDDLKTLNNPDNYEMKNFMGIADKSFFYKYLSK